MKEGNLHPSQLSLYNCHARSTSVGDLAEALAIKSMLAAGNKYRNLEKYLSLTPEEIVSCVNDDLPKIQPILTCQKGNMGHTVAAAAVVESVFSIKCIQE
jgi:3-oxoacyl-(acyl-carrier-protein) synthase